MTDDVTQFTLIDEPWILVQFHDGRTAELSLTGAFEQATEIRRVVGELPTQAFAITRLLLAILHRATPERIDKAAWVDFWENEQFPLADIRDYLHHWSDRFDLLHPETPFYQVADLRTEKGEFTELERLIGDAPTGSPFLTTRLRDALTSLSFAEAARWVVHCQAFDVSGIKSGAIDDKRVKDGKGYPIGMGSAGHIGGILLEGENLLQTLLLNFVPFDSDSDLLAHSDNDSAAWEHVPADGPAPLHVEDGERPYLVKGVVEMLTWQSRRIRLRSDGQGVREVLICNGDRFTPANAHRVEAMTAWRLSEPQAKKLGVPEAYMPRVHTPDRALWRGLKSLLTSVQGEGLQPATIRWVSELSEDILPPEYVPHVRAIGIDYINNSSVTGEVINDEIDVPVQVLQSEREDLRSTVLAAVKDADRASESYANLTDNLDRAAGGDGGSAVKDAARAEAFAALDPQFRRWIAQLGNPTVTAPDAGDAWATAARRLLLELGGQAVAAAGPAAWIGRKTSKTNDRHLDSGLAESWFLTSLYSIFPDLAIPKESA